MTLKVGSGGHFHNIIIDGFSGETIDLLGAETVRRISNGELTFNSMMDKVETAPHLLRCRGHGQ